MIGTSKPPTQRRASRPATPLSAEQQYLAIMSRLLSVATADLEGIHLAKQPLPDRSYYHLVLALGTPAQEVIGSLTKWKEVGEEFLLPGGSAMVLRTARVFALAEMLAADAKDVATWMMTTIELIPGQPSRTPLALCVESQQGARFLESHLLRKLSALHSDRTFQ